jgi:hypothetical protein
MQTKFGLAAVGREGRSLLERTHRPFPLAFAHERLTKP